MTTYQLYLILLGYLTEQNSDQSIKNILLQLYMRADSIKNYESCSSCNDCKHEDSFDKEFDDTCMKCKSGSNRTGK